MEKTVSKFHSKPVWNRFINKNRFFRTGLKHYNKTGFPGPVFFPKFIVPSRREYKQTTTPPPTRGSSRLLSSFQTGLKTVLSPKNRFSEPVFSTSTLTLSPNSRLLLLLTWAICYATTLRTHIATHIATTLQLTLQLHHRNACGQEDDISTTSQLYIATPAMWGAISVDKYVAWETVAM